MVSSRNEFLVHKSVVEKALFVLCIIFVGVLTDDVLTVIFCKQKYLQFTRLYYLSYESCDSLCIRIFISTVYGKSFFRIIYNL